MSADSEARSKARSKLRSSASPDSRKALCVADAKLFGTKAAAEKHGVTDRTVRRWLNESATDPSLSASVTQIGQEVVAGWKAARIRALTTMIDDLQSACRMALEKAREAESYQEARGAVREIAGAVKIVGELDIASEVFGAEHDGADAAMGAGRDERSPAFH